jgi:1,4-alpha-glucan branching enzyme
VPRIGYRIGAPESGNYLEIFNSDSSHYGGANLGNMGMIPSARKPWMGRPDSLVITLPPLAGIILSLERTGDVMVLRNL